MSTVAFERARKLLGTRQGAVFRAQLLGTLQSVLVLGLLATVGLLGVLVTTRGTALIDSGTLAVLPDWAQSRATGQKGNLAIVDDSGLFPLVAANFNSPHPIHSLGGMIALTAVEAVPSLHTNAGALQTLTATAFALILLLTLMSRIRRKSLAIVACDTAASLRRQIHRQMYRLGESSLPNEGTGPVVNLFTREVNDIRNSLFNSLDVESRVPILVLGLLTFLLLVDWKSTLFLAALGALIWLVTRVLRRSSADILTVATRDAAIHLSALQEDLSLLRIVRVFGMENVDKTRFDEHLERYTDADVRRMVAPGNGNALLFLVIGSAAVAAAGVLTSTVVVRQHSPVAIFFLVATLAGLVVPLVEWLRMKKAQDQAGRSANAVFTYLDHSPDLQQAGGAGFLPPLKNRITFENVTLQNAMGRKLLDGLNAEIRAGTRVAIMGLDDDSKYALVCLIPRLIDPVIGRVKVDGIDLKDVTLESIRAQVSTVLQADLVFSDTVLANITLGDESYDLPRVMEAAKLAHAHSFIQDLPQGYDTQIGPLGTYLSPDQQYRIGLARAALHDPSIVIIEEPQDHLPDEVKAYLDDTVSRLSQNRTVIILPHRLSTIRSCDQVIVLSNGHVDASGAPRDMHSQSKLYRHLQYIEFNQFATGEVEAGQMNG